MGIKIRGNKGIVNMDGRTLGPSTQSIHGSFWNALTKSSDSLALSQLWLCCFAKEGPREAGGGSLKKIGEQLNTYLSQYEAGSWNIDEDGSSQEQINEVVLKAENWDSIVPGKASDVYLWTRGAFFIGDGINISRVGNNQNGSTKGMISDGRADLTTVTITFLESNISFVDGFIRPWSVLVSHRSLKDYSLRCDIELFAIEKWKDKDSFRVRKSMLFKNAVPVSIDQEEYNYTGDKLIERQIQFAFDRYEMRHYPEVHSEGIGDISTIPRIQNLTPLTINSTDGNPAVLSLDIVASEGNPAQEPLTLTDTTNYDLLDYPHIHTHLNKNSIDYLDVNPNLNKPNIELPEINPLLINNEISLPVIDAEIIKNDISPIKIEPELNKNKIEQPNIDPNLYIYNKDYPEFNPNLNKYKIDETVINPATNPSGYPFKTPDIEAATKEDTKKTVAQKPNLNIYSKDDNTIIEASLNTAAVISNLNASVDIIRSAIANANITPSTKDTVNIIANTNTYQHDDIDIKPNTNYYSEEKLKLNHSILPLQQEQIVIRPKLNIYLEEKIKIEPSIK